MAVELCFCSDIPAAAAVDFAVIEDLPPSSMLPPIDYFMPLALLTASAALLFCSRSCFRVLNSFCLYAILPMPVSGTRRFTYTAPLLLPLAIDEYSWGLLSATY